MMHGICGNASVYGCSLVHYFFFALLTKKTQKWWQSEGERASVREWVMQMEICRVEGKIKGNEKQTEFIQSISI